MPSSLASTKSSLTHPHPSIIPHLLHHQSLNINLTRKNPLISAELRIIHHHAKKLAERKHGDNRGRHSMLIVHMPGGKYIVFPNAIYGDWEGALHNHNYLKALDTTWSIRRDSLQRLQRIACSDPAGNLLTFPL